MPAIIHKVRFGAKEAGLIVEHHQWWRLVSAVMLHAGLLHILSNVFIQVGFFPGSFTLHCFPSRWNLSSFLYLLFFRSWELVAIWCWCLGGVSSCGSISHPVSSAIWWGEPKLSSNFGNMMRWANFVWAAQQPCRSVMYPSLKACCNNIWIIETTHHLSHAFNLAFAQLYFPGGYSRGR